jgi:hypothetical protein
LWVDLKRRKSAFMYNGSYLGFVDKRIHEIRVKAAHDFIFSTIFSANAEHLTSVAPSIWRARS